MKNSLRRSRGEEEGGMPGWMVTFSDLSTLLLTFFVMLLSMSAVDSKTVENMFRNFSSSSGVLLFDEYSEISKPKEMLVRGLYERSKGALTVRNSPEESTAANPEEDSLEKAGTELVFENFRNGFKIVFGHRLVFDTGRAEIKEGMKPLLETIGTFMRRTGYQVYIDGYTDDVPIRRGEFASNEELSMARAYNLVEHFVKVENVSPQSMALAGYGEAHPVALNKTAEGRSRNRRVEIIFKNQRYF